MAPIIAQTAVSGSRCALALLDTLESRYLI